MKKLTGLINLDEEFSTIMDFINIKWETADNMDLLIKEVWDFGILLSRDKAESNYVLSNVLSSKFNEFMSFLGQNPEQSPPIRLKFFSYLQIIGNKTFLLNDFNYYENEVVVKSMIKKFPNIENIKPLGWDKLIKDYKDGDGMEEYKCHQLKIDKKAFNGTNVEPFDDCFVLNIALPEVMYNEMCQDTKSIVILLMNVLDHSIKCNKHNNSLKYLDDIKKAEEYFIYSQKENIPLSSLSFNNILDNKMFDLALEKSILSLMSKASQNNNLNLKK